MSFMYAPKVDTVINLFCRGDIFGRHSLTENLLLEYYSNMKIFLRLKIVLIRIFRTRARIRGVNSQRCEVELKSAAGYLYFSANDGSVL